MNDELVVTVVEREICKMFMCHSQINDRLWLSGEKNTASSDICLLVSHGPGGAWSVFGSLKVENYYINVRLKTVWGIIRHHAEYEYFEFEFCDPSFPNNLHQFVVTAAINAQRCFDLGHTRMWQRHERNIRTSRL